MEYSHYRHWKLAQISHTEKTAVLKISDLKAGCKRRLCVEAHREDVGNDWRFDDERTASRALKWLKRRLKEQHGEMDPWVKLLWLLSSAHQTLQTSRRPAHPKHELTDGVRGENVTSPQSHHDARPQRRGRDFAPSYYLAKARKVWEVYLARRLLPFGSALPPLDRRRLPLTPVAAPLFHFPPNISVTN